MVGPRSRVRVLLLVTAALSPLVLLPPLLSKSVAPFARAGASFLGQLSALVPSSIAIATGPSAVAPDLFASIADEPSAPEKGEHRVSDASSAPVRRRSRDARGGRVGGGRTSSPGPEARHIFVGPEAIRRVLPASGRPVAVWTNRTDGHPAGMLISQPGALAGTIRAGDILFEAEGTPLTSFEQVVAIVGQRYERGARLVSGRLFRGGESWALTVEPGWVIRSPRAGH